MVMSNSNRMARFLLSISDEYHNASGTPASATMLPRRVSTGATDSG
jgi:hypothetical protein